jgi:hypothetical protein
VVEGLELTAERPAGRRHRIATVIVRDLSAAASEVRAGAVQLASGPDSAAADSVRAPQQ